MKNYILTFILIPCTFLTVADTIQSPFNVLKLIDTGVKKEFSFFSVGHLYGSPAKEPISSASTFVDKIDMLNSLKVDFAILLGDCYYKPDPLQINNFKHTANKIKFPIFNAIGNHEADDWQMYADYFGETYFSFNYKTNVFIFIDLEMINENHIEKQFNYISKITNEILNNNSIKNVFICSHELIWLFHISHLKDNLEKIMWPQNYNTKIDFNKYIQPVLNSLSGIKKVYWLSGDWYLPLFYHLDKVSGITFISTGLGDNEKDAIIKINVDENSEVSFQPISLTGKKLQPLESYTIDYYIKKMNGQNSWNIKMKDFIKSSIKLINNYKIIFLITFFLLCFILLKFKNR